MTYNLDTCRLDRFLKRAPPFEALRLNQSTIEKLLRLKKITVNGMKAKAGTRVNETDVIEFAKGFNIDKLKSDLNNISDLKLKPVNFNYNEDDIKELNNIIIWQDEDITIINKPSRRSFLYPAYGLNAC